MIRKISLQKKADGLKELLLNRIDNLSEEKIDAILLLLSNNTETIVSGSPNYTVDGSGCDL